MLLLFTLSLTITTSLLKLLTDTSPTPLAPTEHVSGVSFAREEPEHLPQFTLGKPRQRNVKWLQSLEGPTAEAGLSLLLLLPSVQLNTE